MADHRAAGGYISREEAERIIGEVKAKRKGETLFYNNLAEKEINYVVKNLTDILELIS